MRIFWLVQEIRTGSRWALAGMVRDRVENWGMCVRVCYSHNHHHTVCMRAVYTLVKKKNNNKKLRPTQINGSVTLQGQRSSLVCNLLYRPSHPFPTECTKNTFAEWEHLSVSAGMLAISDINGSHLRNLAKERDPLGRQAAAAVHRARRVSHFSPAQAVFLSAG